MDLIREMKGAKILVDVCGNVKINERVVIITDTNKVPLAELLAAACWQEGVEPVIITMLPRKRHGEEPPASVAAAIKDADVVFAATTYSLYHSTARKTACEAGVRWVNLPDFHLDMLKEGGLYADFAAMQETGRKLASLLSHGSNVEVRSDKGTNLVFSIADRDGHFEPGIASTPGAVVSPPIIEVNVAPVEGTAEGTLIVDGSILLPGIGLLDNDVVLEVRNGVVAPVSDNKESRQFKSALSKFQNADVFAIAEFGIGLNPQCKLSGRMLEDEGTYGTVHFGLGDNHAMGGKIRCSIHTDVVITSPTVRIDGQLVIEQGRVAL